MRYCKGILPFCAALLVAASVGTKAADVSGAEGTDKGRIVATAPPSPIGDAFIFALNALNAAEDPVVQEGVGFQIAPEEKHAATILLANDRTGAEFPLPFLCRVTSAAMLADVELCDYQDVCGPIEPSSTPVLLCNFDTFVKLTLLMTSMYSPNLIIEFTANDQGYMRLAQLLDEQPEMLVEKVEIDPGSDRIMAQLFPLVLLVLAHEFYHIQDDTDAAHWTAPNANRINQDALATDQICRNYVDFEKNGYYLSGDRGELRLGSMADVYLDGLSKDISEHAASISRAEAAADRYAARVLIFALSRLLEDGMPAEEAIMEFGITPIRHFTLYLWYRQLRAFSVENCGDFLEEEFFLSRCMCRDNTNYKKIGRLFEYTHPPLYLRLMLVVRELYKGFDLTLLDSASRAQLETQLSFFESLLGVPLKLTLGACVSRNVPFFSETEIIMNYPALEGFLNESDGEFFGAPSEDKWAGILNECIEGMR